jgi:uncharacterized protein (TIGR03437 family)
MSAMAAVISLFLLARPLHGGLTQEQFRSDLQYVVTQLPRVHVNLFYAGSSSTFYAGAAQLDADIPQLSTEQFYTRLSALVAMANDAHTFLVLTGSAATALGFNPLPIEFRVFADGIFVVSAPANQASLNGARLVSVGSLAAGDVYNLLVPEVSHVNASGARFGVGSLLSNSGVLRGIGAAPAEGSIRFTVQLRTGEQVTLALPADNSALIPSIRASDGAIPPLLDHSGENYWSEYWANARTVYVRYAHCIEMPDRPVTAFTANTLALIDSHPVDTLVIDLRANGGGSESVTIPLTAGLIQRINSLRANPRFRVYTFTDGGTESAAFNTAADLKYSVIPPSMSILGRAGTPGVNTILAGEPTGGKPGYCGGASNLTLPQSHLLVRYSTTCIPPFEGLPQGDALNPDLPVDIRSTDYFARHDPVLAAALAHALPRRASPTGRAIVLNAASRRYETGVAPGSLASAFGDFPPGDFNVTVNGATAHLVAATHDQLNFLVPTNVSAGQATLEVRAQAELVSEGLFEVTTAGPGLFVTEPANNSQPGAVLNQDNTPNGSAAPASRGTVVQLFATGTGPLDSSNWAPVSVWIANRPAEILFSGLAPGIPGLWQINARIPDDSAIAKQVAVFVSAEGYVSNAVTVFVTDPLSVLPAVTRKGRALCVRLTRRGLRGSDPASREFGGWVACSRDALSSRASAAARRTP